MWNLFIGKCKNNRLKLIPLFMKKRQMLTTKQQYFKGYESSVKLFSNKIVKKQVLINNC